MLYALQYCDTLTGQIRLHLYIKPLCPLLVSHQILRGIGLYIKLEARGRFGKSFLVDPRGSIYQ